MSGRAGVYNTMEMGPTAISRAPIRVTFISLIKGSVPRPDEGAESGVDGVWFCGDVMLETAPGGVCCVLWPVVKNTSLRVG